MDNQESENEYSTRITEEESQYENISPSEIPWSRATNNKFCNSEPENILMLTKFELESLDLENIKKGTLVFKNRVYKNNCSGFNSKYIIKSFLDAPVHAVIKQKEIPGEIDMIGEGGESDIFSAEFLKNQRKESLITTMEKELESLKMRQDSETMFEDIELEEDLDFNYYLSDLNAKKKLKPISYKDQKLLLDIRNMSHIDSRLEYDKELVRIFKESFYDEKKDVPEHEHDETENEEEILLNSKTQELEDDELITNNENNRKSSKIEEKKHVSEEYFLANYYTGKDDELEIRDLSNVNPIYYVVKNEKLIETQVEFPLPYTHYNLMHDEPRSSKSHEATAYEKKPRNIFEFESMMYSSNFSALTHYDLPKRITEDKNLKTISLMDYKTLLDYLRAPSQNAYTNIGILEQGKQIYSVPEERDVKVIFKEENALEDYDLFKLIMDGKGLPDFLDEKSKIALEVMQQRDTSTFQAKIFQNQSQHNLMQGIIGTEENTQYTDIKKLQLKEENLKQNLNEFGCSYVRRDLNVVNSVKSPEDIFHIVSTGKGDMKYCYNLGTLDKKSQFHIIRSCGTVIFDISRSRKEIPDAWYYLKQYLEIKNRRDVPLDDKLHMILITNFLTWSKSDQNILRNISELNFLKRKCNHDYRDYYNLENFVYKIGLNPKYNIKTTIIFSGIPFGHEEDVLAYLFKLGWDNEAEVPIWTSGENILPIIHIDDLSKIVLETVNKHLYPSMVFALTPNYQSLIQLAKAIVENLGNGKVRHIATRSYNERMCIPKIIHDLLQCNIKYTNVNDAIKDTPKYQVPFENFTLEIIQELKLARGLKDVNIILLGPPHRAKFEIGIMLSKFYNIPFFHTNNILQKYLKLVNQIKKRATNNAEESGEELMGEEEEEKVKPNTFDIDPEIEALKKVIDNKVNVNRQWLALCLKKLLKTSYVKNHGYILIDFPVRAEDADYIFKLEEKNEIEGEFMPVSNFNNVNFPEYVFVIDAPVNYTYDKYMLFETVGVKSHKELSEDLNEYTFYRNTKKSIHNFFEFMNHLCFSFDIVDGPVILDQMVNIIGFPNTEKGLTEYWSFLKHVKGQHKSSTLDAEKQKFIQRLEIAKDETKKHFQKTGENLYNARELLLEPNTFEMQRKYDGRLLKEKMKSETEIADLSL